LSPPLLLKSAWGAGSIGQVVIDRREDAASSWATAHRAVLAARHAGEGDLSRSAASPEFLVEEVVKGSTEGWYDVAGYGDYLSVEGIVAQGTYHPICITARIPTIPPFTELSNNAPCVLSEKHQRTIEAAARRAVDALGLDTCGTHTEIKLGADGKLHFIESAARFGGCMVTKEVESVFGLDLIEMLTRELLGETVVYPREMLVRGDGAAASLAIISTDSRGKPWSRPSVFDSRRVDWSTLVSRGTTVEVATGLTIADGTPMPPYDPSGGATNWAGILFLRSTDAERLLSDCYSILDNLEHALAA
jgi:biotin carboxylase